MRSRALCAVLSILFAGSLFLGSDVYAKSSGGSSRSSSSRSSSSGSKSSSKPATPPPSSYGNTGTKQDTSKSPSREGYGNTGTKPSASTPPGGSTPPSGYGNTATSPQTKGGPSGAEQSKSSPLQNQMNRSFSKQESAKAYSDYKAQQSKFQMSSKPGAYSPRETATINSVQSRVSYSSSSDYYTRRTVFYDTYRWSPPVYMYRSYNSFGIWDAMMLWFMLDHIHEPQYSSMYYNHRDDPGMQQFKKEAERLSAENAELKAKVAKLDESAKSLEQKGVKPDPTYMPNDAASIALAASIVDKGAPKSKSFPWMWVVGIGAFVLIGFIFLRRRR